MVVVLHTPNTVSHDQLITSIDIPNISVLKLHCMLAIGSGVIIVHENGRYLAIIASAHVDLVRTITLRLLILEMRVTMLMIAYHDLKFSENNSYQRRFNTSMTRNTFIY